LQQRLRAGERPGQIPIVYRDFVAFAENGSSRHPDFQACYAGSQATRGLVEHELDADSGKPVYTGICGEGTTCDDDPTDECPYQRQTTTEDDFNDWYNTSPSNAQSPANVAVVDVLTLRKRDEPRQRRLLPARRQGLGGARQGRNLERAQLRVHERNSVLVRVQRW
jgi:hypothetical protein